MITELQFLEAMLKDLYHHQKIIEQRITQLKKEKKNDG